MPDTEALEALIPDSIKPKDKLGEYWFRAAVVCLLIIGIGCQAWFKLWIESNYLSQATNEQAWEKQVRINTALSDQLVTLSKSDSIVIEIDKRQDLRLDGLEKDIREQRTLLFK